MHHKKRRDAMVLGAFLGDALALGPHWLYETKVIDHLYGELQGLTHPYKNSYHKEKQKGDLTHYGDQMLLFLEVVSDLPTFQIQRVKEVWIEKMSDYTGYMDKATKASLEKFQEQESFLGSRSDEISALSRSFPLIHRYHDSPYLRGIVEEQMRLTHNHDVLAKMGHFLVDLTLAVLEGDSPSDAMDQMTGYGPIVRDLVDKARKHLSMPPREAIASLGQTCSSLQAFPSVVYLLYKYESDLKRALLENVRAGGDSAARGMLVGGILAAYRPDDLPTEWLEEIRALPTIKNLL